MLIDGLEYFTTPEGFERTKKRSSQFAYFSPNYNPDNRDSWWNKNNIRVYNHITGNHYFLERIWPNIGDNNLLFLDFPRTDAPNDSWSSGVTQTVHVPTWGNRDEITELNGDFVRFTITRIDTDNFCKADDGYSEVGWYARNCFYKILKTF